MYMVCKKERTSLCSSLCSHESVAHCIHRDVNPWNHHGIWLVRVLLLFLCYVYPTNKTKMSESHHRRVAQTVKVLWFWVRVYLVFHSKWKCLRADQQGGWTRFWLLILGIMQCYGVSDDRRRLIHIYMVKVKRRIGWIGRCKRHRWWSKHYLSSPLLLNQSPWYFICKGVFFRWFS